MTAAYLATAGLYISAIGVLPFVRRYGFFGRPACIETCPQRSEFDAADSCPVRHDSALAVDGQKFAAARVFALQPALNPFTVARLIMTLVVGALNRVAGSWKVAHVLQKVWERFPSLTDPNSSASVVAVTLFLWVATTPSHGLPHLVDLGVTHPVSRLGEAREFSSEASAGFGRTTKHGILRCREDLPTLASAFASDPALHLEDGQNRQPSKCASYFHTDLSPNKLEAHCSLVSV